MLFSVVHHLGDSRKSVREVGPSRLFCFNAGFSGSPNGCPHLGRRRLFRAVHSSANTFFGNAIGQPRGSIIYHRWGGTVGGPVLPHLYNGRNRTFFFGGYEGLRQNRVRGTVLTVPTAKERAGDFSDLLKLGSNYQIFDPHARSHGGRALPGNRDSRQYHSGFPHQSDRHQHPELLSAAVGRGHCQRDTDNLPLPNATENAHYYTTMARVDHNFSERHRIFVRVNTMERNSVALDWFHNLTTARPFEFQSRGGIVDDVFSFSPTFVMNFHYGYDRFVRIYDSLPAAHGFDLTTLGFPASYNNLIPEDVRRVPYITIPDTPHLERTAGSSQRQSRLHPELQQVIGSTCAQVRSRVPAYTGRTSFSRITIHRQFEFRHHYTQGPLDNSPASPLGQGLASMMLGIVTSGYIDVNASYAEQSTRHRVVLPR